MAHMESRSFIIVRLSDICVLLDFISIRILGLKNRCLITGMKDFTYLQIYIN